MLTLKNINKVYKTGDITQTALDGINLCFRKNEFVSILGPSGSGKTTLLNIIGGIDNYTNGDLVINNKSTRNFKDSNWDSYRNSLVGFIFQNYNLIDHISVYKNVELALTLSGISKRKTRKKVMEALKKVGLEKHAKKKPNELSGGQMQRVAIARALVNDPEIILADEPTGALDSKTSVQIMELIKKISKDKLVIMVTHNDLLAKKYSTRIISIKDGKINHDTNPLINANEKSKKFNIKKTKMDFISSISLSFDNIRTKKGRTFLTAFASSIGIIGIALILSISNGFNKKIEEYEKDAMSSFPIIVSRNVLVSNKEKENENLYPNKKALFTYNNEENKDVHKNYITNDYVDYINKMEDKYVNAISYSRLINLNLIVKNGNLYRNINSSMVNFVELPKSTEQNSFLKENYDLLSGSMPVNPTDVVLIIDSKNQVDKTLLEALFIDSMSDEIEFDEVLGKELKLVGNNDYYKKVENDLYVINNPCKKIYENGKITLKITGILRAKKDSLDLMKNAESNMDSVSKIGYSADLINMVLNENKESNVVKDQQNSNGIVFMGGLAFDEVGTTKSDVLSMLGENSTPTSLNIYPNNFNSKEKIIKYLDSYNFGKDEKDQIIYTDYAKEIGDLSSSIMNGITIVLISFSSISLVVSSIMMCIITYISVLERTKEIGILRSLGARKKDISRVFNAENLIIGLMSGIIGIFTTLLLLAPINSLLYKLTGLKSVGALNPFHAIILLLISVILTLIGGFIPSKSASKKNPVEALRSK